MEFNYEHIIDMADGEICIKVAEFSNWTCVAEENGQLTGFVPSGKSPATLRSPGMAGYGSDGYRAILPNYLDDLNAMHEVEKIFVKHDGCAWGDDWELYCDNLGKVCFMSEPTNCLCRATAKQRAIAFVMTMDIIKNNNKYVLWRDIGSKNNS